jgi:UDP-N-acetylmuramoyl-tripeptide--D-alanyl-D-alanine ligase
MVRGRRYLQVLQQDEYSPTRFIEWFGRKRAYDTRASGLLMALMICVLFLPGGQVFWSLIGLGAFLILSRSEPDPINTGKVRLIMTERATSIWRLGAIFCLVFWSLGTFGILVLHAGFIGMIVVLLLLVQLLPWLLVVAIAILRPFELGKQARLIAEASKIYDDLAPFSVGITGSYGKTSVKNYLAVILQVCKGGVFWPEKGINTIMGIVREIREKMRPEHRISVVEMAAYRKGSIARLCELARPKIGIITAIGVMHLERFGSEEAIYEAKTELARAIPPDGILICNGDWDTCRRAAREYSKATTLLYGLNISKGHLDAWMEDIVLSEDGTRFKIVWNGEKYSGFTPLMGKPALSNILGAFTAACAMGCNPELVLSIFSTLTPPDNRLSVLRNVGSMYLMDAYNSNPVGFEAALEVLRDIPAQRRILMTPGMIELGEIQYEENKRLAIVAAGIADLVLLIGQTNLVALQSGLRIAGMPEDKILYFDNRDRALKFLQENEKSGDVVLVENDLADWYEDTTGF